MRRVSLVVGALILGLVLADCAPPGAIKASPRTWAWKAPARHLEEPSMRNRLETALARSGPNRREIEAALRQVAPSQREGLEFLITEMPPQDLRALPARFLLDDVDLAYRAWSEAPWRDRVPEEIFLNDVLPYSVVSERRDSWRGFLYGRLRPLVAQARSPAEAAALLNRSIYDKFRVRYSTERSRPDQSPFQAMEEGKASCTGLSVLLVDACRSVGVPARLAGTPLWADSSGNHSWVEIYDGGWHFTGAAEPRGDSLDTAWFVNKAAAALPGDSLHAIYATSFRRTSLSFPLVWDPADSSVSAVDVTLRYTRRGEEGQQPSE